MDFQVVYEDSIIVKNDGFEHGETYFGGLILRTKKTTMTSDGGSSRLNVGEVERLGLLFTFFSVGTR